jgi:hypothetical protein
MALESARSWASTIQREDYKADLVLGLAIAFSLRNKARTRLERVVVSRIWDGVTMPAWQQLLRGWPKDDSTS